jgi:hypothetical protein
LVAIIGGRTTTRKILLLLFFQLDSNLKEEEVQIFHSSSTQRELGCLRALVLFVRTTKRFF